LSIQPLPENKVRVAWTNTATGFVLEQADFLGPATLWTPIAQAPDVADNQFGISLSASAPRRFFRLRTSGDGGLPLTTVAETSPARGETGVAVTRETVLRFSQPLAASTVIQPYQFYAEFGGRRLLSRVQLASDRRTVTLFYLENLPGSARVRVMFDGSGIKDALDRLIDADIDEKPGGTFTLDFETLSITPLQGTAVIGTVMASELVAGPDNVTNVVNKPLQNVIITVDGREQELRAVTDIRGNFTLENVPAGRFFVKVDGRMAAGSQWPDGAYYPFVGKAWEAVAGKKDNLAGDTGVIYLPLVVAGTLQTVSPTSDTVISFPQSVLDKNPALKGASITVPANSLYNNEGVRGGRVGIAPVSPDRLPEVLPPGLKFPLVITVQTDGPSNFDRPVGVRFPNLPDPITGVKLAPGAKSALYSFNHDTGKWELQGPMTVSADGKFVESDPGVGIRQPGWHATSPITTAGGPAEVDLATESDPAVDEILEEFIEEEAKSSACAGEAGELASDILNVADAVRILFTVKGGTQQVKDAYIAGTVTTADICAAIVLLESQRTPIETLLTKLRSGPGSSLERIQAALDCVAEVIDKLEVECNKLDAAPPNTVPSSVALTCDAIPRAREVMEILYDLGSYILTLDVNDIYNQVADIKSYIGCAPVASAASIVASAVLSRLRPQGVPDPVLVGKLDRLLQTFAAFKPISSDDWDFVGEFINTANDTHTAVAGTVPNAYLRLDYGTTVQRGRANSFGRYSFFMPADIYYSVSAYDPVTGKCGRAWARSADPGFPTEVHGPPMGECDPKDTDGDGLSDFAEGVIGTKPDQRDTDGDGVTDGAEVAQGFNPLDPSPPPLGVLIAVQTAPVIQSLCVENDLAAVSVGEAGVELFNVFNPLNPFIIGRVDTPGFATRAACGGQFIAVIDGGQGLAIIDASDPPAAQVIHQVPLETTATAVVARGGLAYVGLSPAEVLVVDLASGTLVTRNPISSDESVVDMALEGEWLYVLGNTRLFAARLQRVTVQVESEVTVAENPQRLFVGGGAGFVTHFDGYDTLDLRNPQQPALVASGPTGLTQWTHLVANGSGVGVALFNQFGAENVRTFDVSDLAQREQQLRAFDLSNQPQDVALHDGWALIGDGVGLLQVLNYQPLDTAGKAPLVALTGNFAGTPAQIDEGALVSVVAQVTEDVLIRRVEFYVDGERVFTDGGFPFQYHFRAPLRGAQRTSVRLRARAIDGGGSEGWSPEVQVNLLPDTTAPAALATVPFDLAESGDLVRELKIGVSEPLDPRSVTGDSFQVLEAGADGQPATADDVRVTGTLVSHEPGTLGVVMRFANGGLSNGKYRAVLRGSVRDRPGNALGSDFAWTFTVTDFIPPQVVTVSPAPDAIVPGGVSQVTLRVTEPLGRGQLIVRSAGPDGYAGTADDVALTGGSSQLTPDRMSIVDTFPAPLGPGHYRVELDPATADFAGNPVQQAPWNFTVPVQTSIAGRVLLSNGSAAANATVGLTGVAEAVTTGSDGRFSTSDVTLDPRFQVYAEARLAAADRVLFGRSRRVLPVHQGVTDVGNVTMQETCEPRFAKDLFPPLGTEAPINCFTVFNDGSGSALYAGLNTQFTPSADASPFAVVKWTGEKWVPVGGPFGQPAEVFPGFPGIEALAVYDDGSGPALYAGGFFETINGASIAGLARWNGSAWVAVGGGLLGGFGRPGSVSALAMFDDGNGPALFVAGEFRQAGGASAMNIAKWNGSGWSALGSGIPSGPLGRAVSAFAAFKGALYATGTFTTAGGVAAQNIARWDGQGWSALGTGLGGGFATFTGQALAVFNDQLLVGGSFLAAGGITANGIARWDGAQWAAVAEGVMQGVSLGGVSALAVHTANAQTELYVLGNFDKAGTERAQGIAKWNGSTWSSLERPDTSVVGGEALESFDDGSGPALYVGYHQFITTASLGPQTSLLPGQYAARWNGTKWSPVGQSLGGTVRSLGTFGPLGNKSLYAGGDFIFAGTREANHVARRTGDLWQPLGAGTDGPVWALAEFAGGGANALYVGGDFVTASGVTANGIAKWDGAQWSALAEGLVYEISPRQKAIGDAYALLVFNDGSGDALYVGGFFNKAGAVTANGVARWNGAAWSALSSGLNGQILTLAVFNDATGPALYAGGILDVADPTGQTFSGVAKWTGSQWLPVGSEGPVNLNSAAYALAVHDDGTGPALYAAGQFSGPLGDPFAQAGVAKWNGANWVPVGRGVGGLLFALASFDDGLGSSLYLGGRFPGFGPQQLGNVARWDGNEWRPLDGGFKSGGDVIVRSLLVFNDGSGPALFLGGSFRQTPGSPRILTQSAAKWYRPTPPCPPGP
jgi:hypothetical protein